MFRKPNLTALETFVDAYLKRFMNTNKRREDRKFLLKALALLTSELNGGPCCTGNSVDLITPFDNILTLAIEAVVQRDKIIRRSYLLSLKRMVAKINEVLYGCCCVEITFDLTGLPATTDAQLQLFDALTNELIFQTAIGGATTQTFCVPEQYTKSSSVYFCVNALVPASCGRDTIGYFIDNHDNTVHYAESDLTVGVFCQNNSDQPFAPLSDTTYLLYCNNNIG